MKSSIYLINRIFSVFWFVSDFCITDESTFDAIVLFVH